jgi:hypothetical protein
VEGFDGELDAEGCGVVDAGGDAFGDLFAVFGEGEFGCRAADEDDVGSADGGGFIEGAAVVIESGLAFGFR